MIGAQLLKFPKMTFDLEPNHLSEFTSKVKIQNLEENRAVNLVLNFIVLVERSLSKTLFSKRCQIILM